MERHAGTADAQVAHIDWTAVSGDLDSQGWAILPALLSDVDCRETAALYARDEGFRSQVIMARHGFGRGEYRYFAYPAATAPGRSPAVYVAWVLALKARSGVRRAPAAASFPVSTRNGGKRGHSRRDRESKPWRAGRPSGVCQTSPGTLIVTSLTDCPGRSA